MAGVLDADGRGPVGVHGPFVTAFLPEAGGLIGFTDDADHRGPEALHVAAEDVGEVVLREPGVLAHGLDHVGRVFLVHGVDVGPHAGQPVGVVPVGGEPVPGGPPGQGRENPVGRSGNGKGTPDVEGLDVTPPAGEFLRDGGGHGGSGNAVPVDDQPAVDPLTYLVGDGSGHLGGGENLLAQSHVVARWLHGVEGVSPRKCPGQIAEDAGVRATVGNGDDRRDPLPGVERFGELVQQAALSATAASPVLDQTRQFLDRGVGDDVHHGDGHLVPHDLPDAGNGLRRQQRVASQVEEVRDHAGDLDVQQVGVDGSETRLQLGAGSDVGCRDHAAFRLGQGGPVHLAVPLGREHVHRDVGPGNHVVRQGARQAVTNAGIGDGCGTLGPPDPTHQPLVPRLAPQVDDALGDAVHGRQSGFDLAQFDAVAADLDLVVGASVEGQLPVRTPAHHVTGAVHAFAGTAQRVGDETRRGHARA